MCLAKVLLVISSFGLVCIIVLEKKVLELILVVKRVFFVW